MGRAPGHRVIGPIARQHRGNPITCHGNTVDPQVAGASPLLIGGATLRRGSIPWSSAATTLVAHRKDTAMTEHEYRAAIDAGEIDAAEYEMTAG